MRRGRRASRISFVVMAEEGKEFTVRLNSNRTTGYQWRPIGPLEEHIVKPVRCEYIPFEGALHGGGGEEIWTFLAVGQGKHRNYDGICPSVGEDAFPGENGYDQGFRPPGVNPINRRD